MEQRVDNQHQFWGPLATLAWGILILLGLVITQAITVVVYIVLAGGAAPRAGSPALESLKYDGRLLSWCTFASAIICGLAVIIEVKLKRGSKLSDYLGLKAQRLPWINFSKKTATFVLAARPDCLHRLIRCYFDFVRQADDTGIHGKSLLVAGIALDLVGSVAGRRSLIRRTILSRISY